MDLSRTVRGSLSPMPFVSTSLDSEIREPMVRAAERTRYGDELDALAQLGVVEDVQRLLDVHQRPQQPATFRAVEMPDEALADFLMSWASLTECDSVLRPYCRVLFNLSLPPEEMCVYQYRFGGKR